MKKLKKEDVSPEVFSLYDDYAHNKLDRRQFMERLSKYAVGGVSLSALMAFMSPDYITTATVQPDNPQLITEYITYPSPAGGGTIKGLFCKPKKPKRTKLPGIVVVHENRGLNPYIEDVGRQAALAGFVTLSPDALSPLGGYPGNDDDGRAMQRERNRDEMLNDFIAAFQFLKAHPQCNGKVGVVGFCFGGWIANMMAVRLPELGAAVAFYGSQPDAAEAATIKTPLMLHFAELDQRVNAGWPDYQAALEENGVAHEAHFYPAVNHGFHNNSTPRYDEAAADLAWQRTIDFFKARLR